MSIVYSFILITSLPSPSPKCLSASLSAYPCYRPIDRSFVRGLGGGGALNRVKIKDIGSLFTAVSQFFCGQKAGTRKFRRPF